MVNDIETIKKVRFFGLNTYEAKIWTALLSRGISTAGELSDIANVPRSRSYDVLESLEKKGFVATKPGKPIKYLAVPPKEVIENVKDKIRGDMEKHLYSIDSQGFNDIINHFQEIYEKNTNENENTVAILKGRKNIYKHMWFLLKNSKKTITSSINPGHGIYTETANETKTKIPVKTKNIGIRVCLVDDNNALLFPLQEKEIHPDYDLCIWIKNKQTTKFLKEIVSSA